MKKNNAFVDKVYKLKGNKAPLSTTINSRHTSRNPLLYFDESKGLNRALRYSSNQKSPFEDEQDGQVVVEPVVFERGMLFVPKQNQVLQKFLAMHPQNGSIFEEVDEEKDAMVDVEKMDLELEASLLARELDITLLETVGRVALSLKVDRMTTQELKRDVRIYAKTKPEEFIGYVNDPMLQIQNDIYKFFDENFLIYKNNKRDVHYNLSNNKKKLLTIPYGEEPVYAIAQFFRTDDGLAAYKSLGNKLEKLL